MVNVLDPLASLCLDPHTHNGLVFSLLKDFWFISAFWPHTLVSWIHSLTLNLSSHLWTQLDTQTQALFYLRARSAFPELIQAQSLHQLTDPLFCALAISDWAYCRRLALVQQSTGYKTNQPIKAMAGHRAKSLNLASTTWQRKEHSLAGDLWISSINSPTVHLA